MQVTNHSFWIVETIRSEFPISVALLPIVINHHDTGWVAIAQDSRRICANILLVLIIDQLDPCVILGRSEQKRVRDFAVRWKIFRRNLTKSTGKRISAIADVN